MKELRPEMIEKIVGRFRALADANRIRLLLRLSREACNVTALTAELNLAQASVSKHLAVLRQAGLVETERRGTQVIYRVRDPAVFDMCEIVCNGVIRQARQEQAALGLGVSSRSRDHLIGRLAQEGERQVKAS